MALNLAVKLKERGHDLIIFSGNEKKVSKQFVEKYEALGLPMHSIKNWPTINSISSKVNMVFTYLGYKNLLSDKVKARYVRSLIKSYKIDLVCSHAHSTDTICLEAIKGSNLPLIMVEHGRYSYFLSQGRKYMLKALLSASGIVAVSNFCNNQLKSYVGASKQVTTIHNGIDVIEQHSRSKFRNELGIQENEIAFGLVARGKPQKGWQAAIDAFLSIKEETTKRIHLIMVGGSGYVDELKEKYKSHKEIHFIGKVPNPTYYMEGMDVGLMLSTYKTEALSLTAIEFLMLGKPVIATNVGGVPEVLEYKGDLLGSLINLTEEGSVNTDELKIEMLRFINGEKSLNLDPSIRELSCERFSLNTCAQSYEKLFQRILSEKAVSGAGKRDKAKVVEA